jgi:glucose-1-phosphate thymidylyltransferase
MTITTGVVLAAGEGTRLRPLTHNRPKPMLPAATRPLIEYVCDALIDAGIERLVLVVGYRRDRVQDHFGSRYNGVPVEYVIQDTQLGSGHALLQARAAVDGPLVAVNGDRAIGPAMIERVVDGFRPDCRATLGVIEHGNPGRYGAVSTDDDRVTGLVEKPGGPEGTRGLINAGIYAFPETVFETLGATPRTDGELPITDTVGRMIEEGAVCGIRVKGLWADATYPWDLLYVTGEVLAHELGTGDDAVRVAESARVHPGATLQGPVAVGPDCEVAAGAVVGPTVALGRNVTVGATASVERAVLDDDTRVGPGATLVDCVAGGNVRLGAGTVVPGGPGDVRVGERIHPDERLGAVFGDRARIGGGVRCVPAALVGTSARVAPGVTIEGNVPRGAEVVR